MAIEICVFHIDDETQQLEWEWHLRYGKYSEERFVYPECREAAFKMAEKVLGEKLEQHLKGIKDEQPISD